MTTFTDLELAALQSIFAETPELEPGHINHRLEATSALPDFAVVR